MGNDQSSERMAIDAMADSLSITKRQLIELRDAALVYASDAGPASPGIGLQGRLGRSCSPLISRRDFHIACAEVGILEAADAEILDKLFTMFDEEGEDRIELIPLVVGITPLASFRDAAYKLILAFEVHDLNRTGFLTFGDLIDVLFAINATASYLGDPTLTDSQLSMIAKDTFQFSGDKPLLYANPVAGSALDRVISHPLVQIFIQGKGTERYCPPAQ